MQISNRPHKEDKALTVPYFYALKKENNPYARL